MAINLKKIKNWGTVGLGVLTLVLLVRNCKTDPQPITERIVTKIDTVIQVKRDTVTITKTVLSEKQVIKEVFVKIGEGEAQKEIERLRLTVAAYEKELSETGEITQIKEIHSLIDSFETNEAKLRYSIVAEGLIYDPTFSIDIFKADTTYKVTVKETMQPKKWCIGASSGFAFDLSDVNRPRKVIGMDLSKGAVGVKAGYVFGRGAQNGLWTIEGRVNFRF
jgi:hypothetical protein